MVLVFDQMRAEYIDRFELSNFQRAQALGVNFDNGIVGHLESNTIISHPVITTGKLPRNLPWATQVMKDTEGRLGPENRYYLPYQMRPQHWLWLHQTMSGDTSLVARVKKKNPGPALAVAQKAYAAYNYGGPYADTIVGLGPLLKEGPYRNHHTLAGENIPEYLSQPVGNRFYLEGKNKWGSGNAGYSIKGAGYVTGTDPDRPGGDVWVGDVVEKFMQNEPEWSVILASFGAIDKVSHALGEHNEPTRVEWAVANGINLEDTLRKADQELGRILDRLEREGLLDETVLVITADHGGQASETLYGRQVPGEHSKDQYYGRGENFDYSEDYYPGLKPLVETGLLEIATMNTMISFWTRPLNEQQRETFVSVLSRLPGISEVYLKKSSGDYTLAFRSPKLKGAELAWVKQHNQKLVNTMGGDSGPNCVGMLFDGHGYALPGMHGGAQELVQRIPLIVVSPNLGRVPAHSKAWARLVDINPMVGRLMGLPGHPRLDGKPDPIEPFLTKNVTKL